MARSSSEAAAVASKEAAALTAQVAQLQQELKGSGARLAAAQEGAATVARKQAAALAAEQEKSAALARELERVRCVCVGGGGCIVSGWAGPGAEGREGGRVLLSGSRVLQLLGNWRGSGGKRVGNVLHRAQIVGGKKREGGGLKSGGRGLVLIHRRKVLLWRGSWTASGGGRG